LPLLLGFLVVAGFAAVIFTMTVSPGREALQAAASETPRATPAPLATPVPVGVAATPLPPPVDTSFEPATPIPVDGPPTHRPGERIVVTSRGRESVAITISQVAEVASFPGEFYTDAPEPGNSFLEAWVEYEALADGVSYNPFDWQVFVDDLAVESGFTFVMNSPEPTLSSGTLPQGRRAAGWVIYEVPTSGRVVMSYGNFGPPLFEVVLRDS
jgi:hypothetical protein